MLKTACPVTPSGGLHGGVTQVETDLNNLNSLSSTLGGETNQQSVAINTSGGSQTIQAEGGDLITSGADSGTYVYSVTSMNFGNQ